MASCLFSRPKRMAVNMNKQKALLSSKHPRKKMDLEG